VAVQDIEGGPQVAELEEENAELKKELKRLKTEMAKNGIVDGTVDPVSNEAAHGPTYAEAVAGGPATEEMEETHDHM